MHQEFVKPTETQLRARRNRSIWLALGLAAFVVLVYVGSLVKFGQGLFGQAM